MLLRVSSFCGLTSSALEPSRLRAGVCVEVKAWSLARLRRLKIRRTALRRVRRSAACCSARLWRVDGAVNVLLFQELQQVQLGWAVARRGRAPRYLRVSTQAVSEELCYRVKRVGVAATYLGRAYRRAVSELRFGPDKSAASSPTWAVLGRTGVAVKHSSRCHESWGVRHERQRFRFHGQDGTERCPKPTSRRF